MNLRLTLCALLLAAALWLDPLWVPLVPVALFMPPGLLAPSALSGCSPCYKAASSISITFSGVVNGSGSHVCPDTADPASLWNNTFIVPVASVSDPADYPFDGTFPPVGPTGCGYFGYGTGGCWGGVEITPNQCDSTLNWDAVWWAFKDDAPTTSNARLHLIADTPGGPSSYFNRRVGAVFSSPDLGLPPIDCSAVGSVTCTFNSSLTSTCYGSGVNELLDFTGATAVGVVS